MNYTESYIEFNKYVIKCKNIIKRAIYTLEDTKHLDFSYNDDINKTIKNHRLSMIDRKIAHTMRMIENILLVNQKMGFKINLQEVMKVAILYHDIGRFRQATWSNTFLDSSYIETNSKFKNHGEDGYDIFINNDFKVDKKFIPVIGTSIKYHLDYQKNNKLNYKYNISLSEIEIDRLLTGNFSLNEKEWQVASLITSLVADIDKLDILYQHLFDFNVVRDYVLDKSMKSLEEISLFWNIPKNEILEYNQLEEKTYIPQVIRIPTKNIPLDQLKISDYYKDCFYNNSWLPLSELLKNSDWNFVSAMWWRLGVFLNQIEFYTNLETVQDTDLLPKIYDTIQDEYKPLFEEVFDYSTEVLVRKKLKDNKGKIYL